MAKTRSHPFENMMTYYVLVSEWRAAYVQSAMSRQKARERLPDRQTGSSHD